MECRNRAHKKVRALDGRLPDLCVDCRSSLQTEEGSAPTATDAMRVMRTFLVVALMATAGWIPAFAAERVDLLLVLAADISRSVDAIKFQLQRSGYAAAFSNPRVIDGIRGGPSRRIAVTFVEWSGPLSQETVIDWTVIGDEETAHQFSDRIVEAPRAFADSTSISAGIDFAITRLDQAPYEAHRRVIDVSGDGDNNAGRDVAAARDEAIAKGVTINGLVILTELPSLSYSTHTNPPGGLANYYRRNVIGGPGAFVVVAENFNSFGNAIIKKLIREIAQPVPQQRPSTQRHPGGANGRIRWSRHRSRTQRAHACGLPVAGRSENRGRRTKPPHWRRLHHRRDCTAGLSLQPAL
jgi:Protein of unknown function (DUF1194)